VRLPVTVDRSDVTPVAVELEGPRRSFVHEPRNKLVTELGAPSETKLPVSASFALRK
jgi:hypothetical protein